MLPNTKSYNIQFILSNLYSNIPPDLITLTSNIGKLEIARLVKCSIIFIFRWDKESFARNNNPVVYYRLI